MSFQNRNIDLDDLKIKEVQAFLALSEVRSVRELARQRGLQPGQISKIIKSLEQKIQAKLFERSLRGVVLTSAGRELLPYLNDIYEASEALATAKSKQVDERKIQHTVASTSFFCTHLLAQICAKYAGLSNGLRFSLIELAPSEFFQVGLFGAFEMCLHINPMDWPSTWHSKDVGALTWRVFCREGHPVLKRPVESNVLKWPFVFPVYWTKEGMKRGDDQCPVSPKKRIIGHETATAMAAIEVIKSSDQIGFLPAVFGAENGVRSFEVKKWPKVTRNVYLTVKSDQVSKGLFDKLSSQLAEALEKV